ncbi:serine hydrolase [uncultured Psychroserpens sp.]|uniref:serine hydrolase domain-containing protein n=1 Tax=uncultured Psychroserpens sp. TaxID=255436 RepID=UPI00261D66F4|nr:serine hydrolase domain-containing protein [uncultured Psychroserpens sp.]
MKRTLKLCLTLIIICFTNLIIYAQDYEKKIEELLEANVGSIKPFNGSLLVAKKGEIIYRGAFGLADLSSKRKNVIDSKYFIGSITKLFTAVAILQLVEEKKIALDDKLSRWLPDINGSEKITIHHLLTHQSGLRRDSHQDYNAETTYTERLFSVQNDSLMFEPGEKQAYSSVGFYALSYILEAVSNMSFEAYFKTHIFEPSNMLNTGVKKQRSQKVENLSNGIGKTTDTHGVNDIGNAQYFDSYSFAGGGSLYSTVDDMWSFFTALEKGKLLSHNTVRMMKLKWPVKEKNEKSRLYYSYGWEIYDYSNQKGPFLMIDFAGKIYGYKSMIRYYEKDDIVVIALCNSEFSERSILAHTIRKILLDKDYKLPKPSPKYIPIDESMKHYIGIYDFPSEKTTAEIKMINGKYSLTSHGDKPIYLYPTSENTFYAKIIPLKITFIDKQKMEFNFNDEMIETLNRITE